eukprot:2464591-Amphidinium_carterae.1
MAGEICLLWFGLSSETVQFRVTAVPLHYLRPWRPTLLEMRTVGTDDHNLVHQWCKHLASNTLEDADADVYATLELLLSNAAEPRMFTPWEFLE